MHLLRNAAGAEELALTLRAVAKNVKYMSKVRQLLEIFFQYWTLRKRLRRPTFWQSIAVAIVSDGRAKASPSVLKWGTQMGP